MSALTFLSGLPAVLGVVGFFAYLWAGQSKVGGDLMTQIVKKLRDDPNLNISAYGDLSPAKLGRLVQTDAQVRSAVNEGDQKLLRLLIILQHALTVIVLLVCAGLIGLSVWLVSRPQPFSATIKTPAAVNTDAKGLLVDLDPLDVQWQTQGTPENVAVYLENVETGTSSPKHNLGADIKETTFNADEVLSVAKVRSYHGKNRIRAVISWAQGSSPSPPVDLLVGIHVDVALFGHLIGPRGDGVVHTMLATIDDSTKEMPTNYCFTGDLIGRTKANPIVIPVRTCDNDSEIKPAGLNTIDFDRPVGLVYTGPDDDRIVRTRVTGRP